MTQMRRSVAMKKKTIVLGCAAIVIGLVSCVAIHNLRRGEVFPVDDIGSTNSWLGRILPLALGCGLAVAVSSLWILRRRAT